MSYMRASFLMRKTRYVKTYVKWTELFGNREKATILNRGKSPYTKGVIVVDIVDKALRMGEGRQIKKLENVAKATNALEDEIAALDDEELKGQTAKFKQRIENGESLDKLMPEAFATVREASKRTLGLRHFDVQLMGGAALHWGNIAEMKTGEGKTLVATLPAYLNALDGQGVHVVTVNDYLASYQAELMGRVYRFRRSVASSTTPTSPTAPTTNSVLITCATTWRGRSPISYSVATTTPSSMRSTPFLSMRLVPR